MRIVGSPAKYAMNKVVVSTLKKLCEEPLSVLDVGCGDGNYANFFKPLGCSYCGIDIKKYPGWTTDCMVFDAAYLDLFWGKYNLILSIHSLEHIRDDLKAVHGMASRLADGGVILLALPGKASFLLYPSHGFRRYSIADIKELAEKSGLVVDEFTETGGIASSALHLFTWTIPSLLGKKVSLFLKRHAVLVEVFYKLEQWCSVVDDMLRYLPSNYVVKLSNEGLGE